MLPSSTVLIQSLIIIQMNSEAYIGQNNTNNHGYANVAVQFYLNFIKSYLLSIIYELICAYMTTMWGLINTKIKYMSYKNMHFITVKYEDATEEYRFWMCHKANGLLFYDIHWHRKLYTKWHKMWKWHTNT